LEKTMIDLGFFVKRRWSPGLVLVVAAGLLLPFACKRPAPEAGLTCKLVELRPDPTSGYYDAVVRLESVSLPDALKDRFQVITPTSTFDLSALPFTVEGSDPSRLEAGDTFTIPLKRPDWKFFLGSGQTEVCSEWFWDRLPPADRWDPTKSQAMEVARTIEIVNDRGLNKPMPASLPDEWQLTEEKQPEPDDPVGSLLYQKIRGDRPVEQVEIQYSPLTPDEKAQLTISTPAEFLSTWSECAKTAGLSVVVAGHPAVACNLEGVGEFGWTYRYFYTVSDMVIAVEIQADPQELSKTAEEKEKERRTDQVFLRYGYGPVGPQAWQVMIEVRMNRTGTLHKRSGAGETADKDFTISDAEFASIEKALADNRFADLESRSMNGGGIESFVSVRLNGRVKSVVMKNFREAPFENIASTIRKIVLPKVEERELQPPLR
jgi:hypothetical protein